jgi:hypothetical protein
MKHQIKKLIELANEYHKYAMDNNLPMTHNYLREYQRISVYLSTRGDTWAVDFGEVEISNYSSKITFPFDTTEHTLEELYDDAHQYLYEHLLTVPEYTMEELVSKLGNFKIKK